MFLWQSFLIFSWDKHNQLFLGVTQKCELCVSLRLSALVIYSFFVEPFLSQNSTFFRRYGGWNKYFQINLLIIKVTFATSKTELDIKFCFTCGKCNLYYEQVYLKIFISASIPSEKSAILAQKRFYKKAIYNQSWKP